jgi:excisionase family DNA binding protein
MPEERAPLEPVYTVREVADAAKQHELTVRRHIYKGALHVVKVGGSIRITKQEAMRYLGHDIRDDNL